MRNRNAVLVAVFGLITCGIYHIYWLVSTKLEMNERGADIPTAWLLIIPIVNIYWLWKWAQGVEKITNKELGAVPALLLCWFLGIIGDAITQSYFNKTSVPPVA